MATPDNPQGPSPAHGDDNKESSPRVPQRSRLEETLVKSSIWKKQTLGSIEQNRVLGLTASNDSDVQTARLLSRLSAQLDERNDEIDRLRREISKLENEKSELSRAHAQELEARRIELHALQDAYDQFEAESDKLLSELSQAS